MLISDTLPVMKNYFDFNIIQKEMQDYFNVLWDFFLRWTSTVVNVYIGRHQGAKIACCDVCNGTDHEFSHDAETLCYVRIKFLQYEMKSGEQ